MTGLLLATGGVGTLAATTPLVWLSSRVGWRNSFLLVGGLTLVMAILVGIFVRNRPADLGWPSPLEPAPSGASSGIGLAAGVKKVLACGAFWPLAAWFFFDFGIFFSFAGLWGGPYLVHVYGMSRAETGRILTMLAVGLVVGAPAVSWLSDRVFRRRKPVLVICAAGVIAVTGLLAFQTDGIPRWGLYGVYFLMTFFGNAAGVIAFTMNKELFPIGIAGTATGLVNLFPFFGGAVYQPVLGYVLERWGSAGEGFSRGRLPGGLPGAVRVCHYRFRCGAADPGNPGKTLTPSPSCACLQFFWGCTESQNKNDEKDRRRNWAKRALFKQALRTWSAASPETPAKPRS